jgi:hypothetical protein
MGMAVSLGVGQETSTVGVALVDVFKIKVAARAKPNTTMMIMSRIIMSLRVFMFWQRFHQTMNALIGEGVHGLMVIMTMQHHVKILSQR